MTTESITDTATLLLQRDCAIGALIEQCVTSRRNAYAKAHESSPTETQVEGWAAEYRARFARTMTGLDDGHYYVLLARGEV